MFVDNFLNYTATFFVKKQKQDTPMTT